jgi:hypothetical protein
MSIVNVKQDPLLRLHFVLYKELQMVLQTNSLIWITATLAAVALAGFTYRYMIRRRARRETARMTEALAVSHTIFTALEHLPDALINRDLRRGLVLLLTHHIDVLRETNGLHPHLREMQDRATKLNRIPSALQRSPLRNKSVRRHASLALDEIAKILKEATRRHILDRKTGALASAAAIFSAQQVAVETARQAAKDAENVRAYPKALNLAHQARALCRELPPLVGKALIDAVTDDIEHLESLVRHPAKT